MSAQPNYAANDRQPATLAERAAATYALTDSFEAWRVRDTATAVPLEVTACSVEEALQQAQASCGHKDTLLLLQTHARTEKQTLHVFRIRQGKRVYRGVIEGFVTPLHAEPQFAIGVVRFQPEEPFRWSADCDVVGVDRRELRA